MRLSVPSFFKCYLLNQLSSGDVSNGPAVTKDRDYEGGY